MRCYHAVRAPAVQLRQDRLSDGPAGGGLCARAEFVDEDEGLFIGLFQGLAHIGQEGAVGGEVVVDGLVVPDGYHYAAEDRELRGFRRGDEHTPLEHILEQAHGLEAHGFAARVGAGNHQNVLLRGEVYGEGDDLLVLLAQVALQDGVAGFAEAQAAFFRDDRHPGHEVQGNIGLGHYKVQFADEFRGCDEVRDPGAQEVRKFAEDAADFAGFGKAEFGEFAREGHDFRRFDEGGLAAGAFVVDVAGQEPLFGR